MVAVVLIASLAVVLVAWVLGGWLSGCDPFHFWSGRRIYLVTAFGEIRPSRERTDKNGERWAYVYPVTRTGHVVLCDDGTTAAESSFVQFWRYERAQASRACATARYVRRAF